MDMDQPYQMSCVRPRFRFGGYRRQGPGRSGKRKPHGRGKSRGRVVERGKGRRSSIQSHYEEPTDATYWGDKGGKSRKGKHASSGGNSGGKDSGCNTWGSKWRSTQDCP
eukprot:9477976-Pyramimonas_sp.AAC.1